MRTVRGLMMGAALLGATACSEDPALYFGGPPGPAVSQDFSSQNLVLVVGDSVAVGARAHDAVGNITADAPALTACGSGEVAVGSPITDEAFTTSAWIRGVGLGLGCVVATTGGLTDTVLITTGPAGVRVTGPDTLISGSSANFTTEAVDRAGSALTGSTDYRWSASVVARLGVNPFDGSVAGKAVGTANVIVRAPGGANNFKPVVVVPGALGATLSATTLAPGQIVKLDKAADQERFDADVGARFGATTAFVDLIDNVTGSTMWVAVPATGSTAALAFNVFNLGGAQVERTTQFTITKTVQDVHSPSNLETGACSGAGVVAPDYATAKSPGGWVYLTHQGSSMGTRGPCNGTATGNDHYILYTTGAAAQRIDVEARWLVAGDNDIYVCPTAAVSDACPAGFSSGTLAELNAVNINLAANTSYYVIFSPWTHAAGVNQIRIKITRDF